MAFYDPGQLYFDPILTNFSLGWQDQRLFGLRLFPETPVNTASGRYRVYDRSNWFIHRSRREPGTVANEVGARKWSEDVFITKEHSLQSSITDEERKELHSQGGIADPTFGGDLQIDPEEDAVAYIKTSIQLEHEFKVATLVRDPSNYPTSNKTTLTGGGTGTQWSNYALATAGQPSTSYSNPVANIRLAAQTINVLTGRWPNTMILPFDAVGVVEEHPRVVDRFKNFSLSEPDAWRRLLGLPPEAQNLDVFVVDSKYNAADNIDLDEDITSFWGQDIWIGIVDPTPGQKTMTFGKTFAENYENGGTTPTDRWREEDRRSDLVRYSWKYDPKIVSSVAGYLITNAVAPIVV